MGGRVVRVEVRLRDEEADALDRLARRAGGRAKAIRLAILALEDRLEILDRLDRIEARLGSMTASVVSEERRPPDDGALRAVVAGILALEEDE